MPLNDAVGPPLPPNRPPLPQLGRTSAIDRVAQGRPRYLVHGRIGSGATAEVYAVTDNDLAREGALKVLHGEACVNAESTALFLEEARVTANLEHPNVLPVHDLDRDSDGRLYFIMKRIEGVSLAEAIASSAVQRHHLIRSVNDVVTLFIAIGRAVSFAHARGIRHHDIKPANIMLGLFGEVMLADWGSAGRARSPTVARFGTLLYASPEQIRGEPVDDRSDQYGYGASLFETLFLRPPLCHAGMDTNEFIACKAAGTLTFPSTREASGIPSPLLAIVIKSLCERPDGRYRDVSSLVDDLRSFQAGLAVAAYPEPFHRRVGRWIRLHARVVISGIVMTAVVISLVCALVSERLKDRATWGLPTTNEHFDATWRDRWNVIEGDFTLSSQGICSTRVRRNIMAFSKRCDGATAIEVHAHVASGAPLGDLAIGWSRTAMRTAADVTYRCAFGEWDGTTCAIKCDDRYVARSEEPIQIRNRDYLLRMEIVGERISFAVDGHIVCTYVSQFPLTGGYLALFAFDPGKSFTNVVVRSLGVSERLPATALGDYLANNGSYSGAIEEYLHVSKSFPRTLIGNDAAFRSGICHLRQGDCNGARQDFQGLSSTQMILRADLELAASCEFENDSQFIAACTRACTAGDGETTDRAAQLWAERLGKRMDHVGVMVIQRYIDFQRQMLARHALARSAGAEATWACGDYQDVIAHYPEQARYVAEAMVYLGRGDEALQRFSDRPILARMVLSMQGRWQEISSTSENGATQSHGWGLIEQGRAEEASTLNDRSQLEALLALGRFTDATRVAKDSDDLCRIAMLSGDVNVAGAAPTRLSTRLLLAMAERRLDDALALAPDVASCKEWPRLLAGVRSAREGRYDRLKICFSASDTLGFSQRNFTLAHFIIAPFIAGLFEKDNKSVTRACLKVLAQDPRVDQQRPWNRAAYLTGKIDGKAFLAQPHRQFAQAEILLLDGIRKEVAGDGKAARADYSAYLALPRFLRGAEVDPVIEEFVEWRLTER